jgi:LysR family transcriptional regulator (chromosome initiation inhibitor)
MEDVALTRSRCEPDRGHGATPPRTPATGHEEPRVPTNCALGLDRNQLAALAAVIEFGTFDLAAGHLHVTPSAVSQRIKALEQRIGQVLVVRANPCRPTRAGRPLLRLAAQVARLESEALVQVGGGPAGQTRAAIAVNADSMATWFTTVLAQLPDVLWDIRIEDEDHSARLLHEGAVIGAVTTDRTPVSGCQMQSIGMLRYLPVASPAYMQRLLPQGFSAKEADTAPSLVWDHDDALQDTFIRNRFHRTITRPVKYVPTSEGIGAALRSGLGWAMYPEQLAAPLLADGSLRTICPQHLDVPLFWQCWNLDSPTIAAVTMAVQSAAKALRRNTTNTNDYWGGL